MKSATTLMNTEVIVIITARPLILSKEFQVMAGTTNHTMTSKLNSTRAKFLRIEADGTGFVCNRKYIETKAVKLI